MGLLSAVRRLFRPQTDASSGNTGASADPAVQNTAAADPASDSPAWNGRVLLIHGYSASGEDFLPWRKALEARGITPTEIEVANYVSLNNEVTIKDLGEAFDRALRFTNFPDRSRGDDWTFDAIVHSTGMLVLRQWLTSDPYLPGDPRSRVRRLKHLVGLAPATFGSPQARKGRSWLGALVKGDKQLGPDFLNAGDEVLDGLELASKYTWDLTHKDMLEEPPLYSKSENTPYVAVFIGNRPYKGISGLANTPGTDGTVRWAGSALNSRKINLDFRRHPRLKSGTRSEISKWSVNRLAAPIIAVNDQDHGSIVSDPQPAVVDLVYDFLNVTTQDGYDAWENRALAFGAPSQRAMDTKRGSDTVPDGAGWQQIVLHMVDDHGDGVTDYNLQLYYGDDLSQSDDPGFACVPLIADTYTSDNSYRCFYIQLTNEMLNLDTSGKKMWVELVASSGSALIEYLAYTEHPDNPQRLGITAHDGANSKHVKMDITPLTRGGDSLFYPYTTTLLEIYVQREPMPLGDVSSMLNFPSYLPRP
jgi:hypothetical protein